MTVMFEIIATTKGESVTYDRCETNNKDLRDMLERNIDLIVGQFGSYDGPETTIEIKPVDQNPGETLRRFAQKLREVNT